MRRYGAGESKSAGLRACAAVLAVLTFGAISAARAAETPSFPYFSSVRSDTVNMREGPSAEHKVKWVYHHRGLPLEIIAAYDVWRQIRDRDGETGWIHVSMLSRERTAVLIGDGDMAVREGEDGASAVIANAQPGAIGRLETCTAIACRLAFGTVKGWVNRALLWGIHDNETF